MYQKKIDNRYSAVFHAIFRGLSVHVRASTFRCTRTKKWRLCVARRGGGLHGTPHLPAKEALEEDGRHDGRECGFCARDGNKHVRYSPVFERHHRQHVGRDMEDGQW